MAEVLLRARLAPIAPEVVVGSAGLLFDGRGAEPKAIKTVDRLDLDLRDHRARTISADLLSGCSLILGMEREHVRRVVALDEALFARTFTLLELVAAAKLVGPRRDDETLRAWAERIGSLRDPADLAHADPLVEVRDPYGSSSRTYRACAQLIDDRLAELVELAWPLHPTGDAVAPIATGGSHADRDRR